MPLEKMSRWSRIRLSRFESDGVLKGAEPVITRIKPAAKDRGPRYIFAGDDKEYIRVNSNSYLGMTFEKDVIRAEEETAKKFGSGPGSVRFINGTYQPHVDLEAKLAEFHDRESAMIFSSAYAAVCGVISPLISEDSAVLSDALNHNSIINAIRLSKPKEKRIYAHLDVADMEERLEGLKGLCSRVLLISDGVFSMRGDFPDLKKMVEIAGKHDVDFEGGVVTLIDDSHGVGACGRTGRGVCEVAGEYGIDVIISTLGKALGVNGGYAVSDGCVIDYLRETAPLYVYSNPITPAEAGAALKALEILDSEEGRKKLAYLKTSAAYFRHNVERLGYETLEGEHPIVPLMLRDTGRTAELTRHLKTGGILATGLKYPVVPRGDECIRFQISCSHTRTDIDYMLDVLSEYEGCSARIR